MAELIRKEDTLNQGREKLNEAIKDAETAKGKSESADVKATQALAKSESTQTQLDTIVINGDSSVEAAQARVDAKGESYTTLKARLDAEHTEVTAQLADTISDLGQRGVNILKYGLVGDGTENIVPYILQAFTESNHVIIPRDSVFLLSEELEIPEGKSINFSKSLIRFDNPKSCINISPNVVLDNLRISVNGDINLEKSVLYFDGNKCFPFAHNRRTVLNNIYVEQQNGQYNYENTFIHFDANQKTSEACYISGVTINNVSSMRFKYGIRNTVKRLEGASPCYITSNRINGYTALNPINFIWDDDVVGDGEISGNIYSDVQCQPGDGYEKVFLRLVGNKNTLQGVGFWDVGRPLNQSDQIIILGSSNYIQGINIPAYPSTYIRNEGSHNTIIGGYPSSPSLLSNLFIAEQGFKKIHDNMRKDVPFNLSRSITQIKCNADANSNATDVFDYLIKYDKLPTTGYSTIDVKAFGVAEAPSNRFFRLQVNDIHFDSKIVENSYADRFWLEGKFVLRKYSDRILVKATIKVDFKDSSNNIILYGTRTFGLEDIKCTIKFASNEVGKMTIEYVESEMSIQ